MQNAVPQGQGAMAAILGLEDAKVLELCEQVNVQGRGSVEAANYNAQGQVVIAGDKTLVEAVMALAKENGGKAIALPVSVPSHCSLMKPAAEQFAQALEQTAIELPRIPVIQNVNAGIAADVAQLGQALHCAIVPIGAVDTRPCNTYKIRVLNISWNVAQATYLANLAKRLPNIEKAFPLDTQSRMEDALNAILVAEGKIA